MSISSVGIGSPPAPASKPGAVSRPAPPTSPSPVVPSSTAWSRSGPTASPSESDDDSTYSNRAASSRGGSEPAPPAASPQSDGSSEVASSSAIQTVAAPRTPAAVLYSGVGRDTTAARALSTQARSARTDAALVRLKALLSPSSNVQAAERASFGLPATANGSSPSSSPSAGVAEANAAYREH